MYDSDFMLFDTYFPDMSQKSHFLTHILIINDNLVYKFIYFGSITTLIIKNSNKINILV